MLEAPRTIIVTPPRKTWQGQNMWPPMVRITAALLLIVFVTASLHGHWPLTLALTGASLGFWRLNELWRRRGERLEILEDVDAMPYRKFVLYVAELLRAQGYTVLSSDYTDGPQADLLLSRGRVSMACWLQHGRQPVGVERVVRAAATVQTYAGWRAMLLSSQRLTLRNWYRVRWGGCLLIDRDRLARLIAQHRRGHRVIALPREEKTRLRRRK
jgi:hypothetical protein